MDSKCERAPDAQRETGVEALQTALQGIVHRRVLARGEVDFPCIPALLDTYVADLLAMWKAMGKQFSDEEGAQLKRSVAMALRAGFEATPYARMVVSYEAQAPPHGVRYGIRLKENTIEQHYEHWLSERKPPLFGAHPDAKVIEVAATLGNPREARVLDVGAGTGRNAIALARRGHPTTGVELVAALAEEMTRASQSEHLPIDVVAADVLLPEYTPPRDRYKLVVLSEVASHFRDESELRTVFEKFAEATISGGVVLVNLFMALDGYEPDAVARELSEVSWSRIFTRRDIAFITEELPFDVIDETSVHDHEKRHAPADAWPPTSWFVDWTQGRNVFDLPVGRAPIELRWFTYRRR
jgi:SAM-dependent methyltransferase